MCLGTHNPNTNAALHAWANHCRCHLIISSTCSLSWSVNSGTISSSPLFPSTDRCSFDWWRLHRSQFLCCWSCIFTKAHRVLKKDNTCPVFNGNFVLGGLFGMHTQWLCGGKRVKSFKKKTSHRLLFNFSPFGWCISFMYTGNTLSSRDFFSDLYCRKICNLFQDQCPSVYSGKWTKRTACLSLRLVLPDRR